MEEGKLNMLIGAFLLIVLGAVFVGVLSDQNWLHRNTYLVSNESLSSVSNATATQIAHYPVASISYLYNNSVLVPANNYTKTTDSVYNMYNGKYYLNDVVASVFEGEDLNITYTYYPSGYVRDSTAKTLLNLIPLFFVVALLIFVAIPVIKKLEWI